MNAQQYKAVAIQAGDILKYSTSINEIDRAARSVFNFSCDHFPNESITSSRAQRIHDWVLSLSQQKLPEEERNRQLIRFLSFITPEDRKINVDNLLSDVGIKDSGKIEQKKFMERTLH